MHQRPLGSDLASVTDTKGVGHTFAWDYDASKRLYYAAVKSTSGLIEEHWYDEDKDEVRRDINGRTVQIVTKFNSDDSLPANLSLLTPGGVGRNLVVRDEKGNITKYYFDENENLTKVVNADNTEVKMEYDLKINKPRKITNSKGVYSTYEYDDKANLVKTVDAVGTAVEKTVIFTYDSQGQMLTATIHARLGTLIIL